jgi:hypothetical protein
MLFRETVAVYCENNREHINIFFGKNAQFKYIKAGDKYSNRCDLRVNRNLLECISRTWWGKITHIGGHVENVTLLFS